MSFANISKAVEDFLECFVCIDGEGTIKVEIDTERSVGGNVWGEEGGDGGEVGSGVGCSVECKCGGVYRLATKTPCNAVYWRR